MAGTMGAGTAIVYDIVARDKASKVFRNVASQAQMSANAMIKTGRAMSSVGRQLSRFTLPLAIAGAASVKMATDFQSAMQKISTQAGASQGDVELLSKQVLDMKNMQQGPVELANALYHLKSVGMDNADAMSALAQASKLAAVGGSDLEETVNVLAGAWRSGIKGTQDFGKAVSTLNAIVGAGNMRMQDLVNAFGTGVLPVATAFGLSLKDVGAALAVMTDEGVPADAAATRLRMTFSMMASPSGVAAKALATVGMNANTMAMDMRKPNGVIMAIQDLEDHIHKAGLSTTEASQLISSAFGRGRSSAGILTLINNFDVLQFKQQQITDTMGKFQAAVIAQGKTAQAQFNEAKASLEKAGIVIGQDLLPPLVKLVGSVQKGAEWFAKLPDATKRAAVAMGLILAAAGPLLNLFGNMVRITGMLKTALIASGIAGQKAGAQVAAGAAEGEAGLQAETAKAKGLGGYLTTGLVMAALAAAAAIAKIDDSMPGNKANSVDQITNQLNALNQHGVKANDALSSVFHVGAFTGNITDSGLIAFLSAGTNHVKDFSDAVDRTFNRSTLTKITDWMTTQEHAVGLGGKGTYDVLNEEWSQLDQTLYQMVASGHATDAATAFKKIAAEARHDGVSLDELKKKVPQYSAVVDSMTAQMEKNAKQTNYARAAHEDLATYYDRLTTMIHGDNQAQGKSFDDLNKAIQGVIKQFTILNNGALSHEQALEQYNGAIQALTASVKDNGHSLDVHTAKGLANRQAILGAVQAIDDRVKADTEGLIAQGKTTQATKVATTETDKYKQHLIEAATKAGFNRDQVKKMVDQMVKTPGQIKTEIQTPGITQAQAEIKALQDEIDRMKNKQVAISFKMITTDRAAGNQGQGGAGLGQTNGHLAAGGPVRGPGTGTSDSIPAYLSNGEFVVNAQATSNHRALLEMINAGKFASGGLVSHYLRLATSTAGGSAAERAMAAAYSNAIKSGTKAATKHYANSFPTFAGLSGGTSGANQKLGMAMMLAAGWPASQWPALKALWTRESGWNANAVNPSSGAYGIPQALGHGHPFALGDARAQIAWGLNYIRSRYGSPGAAWGHETAAGWYRNGGVVRGQGTSTSDSVPIRASVGEVVIPASIVRHFANGGLVTKNGNYRIPSGIAHSLGASDHSFADAMNWIFGGAFAKGLGGTTAQITSAFSELRTNIGRLFTEIAKKYKQGDKLALSAQKQFIAQLSGDEKKLKTVVSDRAKLADKMSAAQDKLKNAIDTRNQYKATVTGNLNSFGSAVGAGATAGQIQGTLRGRLQDLQRFARNLAQLQKNGIDRYTYQAIVDAGIDGGGLATSDALLRGGTGALHQINALESKIHSVSSGIGTAASNHLYQGSVRSAQASINSLKRQDQAMAEAGKLIAHSIVDVLDKRLGKGDGGKEIAKAVREALEHMILHGTFDEKGLKVMLSGHTEKQIAKASTHI